MRACGALACVRVCMFVLSVCLSASVSLGQSNGGQRGTWSVILAVYQRINIIKEKARHLRAKCEKSVLGQHGKIS